jgi:hypothetical protein
MIEREEVTKAKRVGYAAGLVIFLAAVAWTFLSR